MWFQLASQFVFIITALKLDFFYCYATYFIFLPTLQALSRNSFWICPDLNTFTVFSWMNGRENAKWDITSTTVPHLDLVVFWVREAYTAPCLAWEHICKEVVSSPWNTFRLTLETENQCLLLKFCMKLLDPLIALSQHCWASWKPFEGLLYLRSADLKVSPFALSIHKDSGTQN